MRTTANNTDRQNVQVFRFKATKFNKHSTIYSLADLPEQVSFITPTVKIEKNQRFARTDTSTWFRLKDNTSWNESELVTGLYRTEIRGLYYGDRRDPNNHEVKTLLIFKLNSSGDELEVFEYPRGYYPSPVKIREIAKSL